MSHAYVIQIEHAAVGLVIRKAEGYRFYATKHSTSSLQRNLFETTYQAYQAVLDLHGRSIATRSSVSRFIQALLRNESVRRNGGVLLCQS